jgi:UDP-glucose 4-epimerase
VHTNSWGGNLDKGCGFSVAEVIKVAAHVSAQPVSADVCLRRPGDPPILVSDSSKAREQLGVVPRQHAERLKPLLAQPRTAAGACAGSEHAKRQSGVNHGR